MSPPLRTIAFLLLLIVGVQFWLIIGRGQYGSAPRPLIFFAVAALASLPFVYRPLDRVFQRVRQPSPRTRLIIAAAIFVIASIYLIATGFAQRRDMFPRIHDEHMHLLQTQMLARGKLWMPAHPAADSFESFHIFVKPKYASIYFPGTALMYVPSVWLRLPYWLGPALVAAAAVALMYRVTAELIDGLAGILAALLLLSLEEFRFLSLVMMSHSVMAMLGLAVVAAFLCWRRSPTLARAALVGGLGGFAAITRPLDAICWSLPLAVAMLLIMRRWQFKKLALSLAVIAAAAVPFLALQLALNIGLTGHPLRTPYRLYCDLYTPHMSFGFHDFDPTIRPQTNLLQRQMYYDDFTVPAARAHRPDMLWKTWITQRLPLIAALALPSQLLLILVPPALLALSKHRWVVAAVLPLFVAFYLFFAYLLSFYIVVVAPAVIFIVLLGVAAAQDALPRLRPWIASCSTAIIVLLALRAMPQFNRLVRDDTFNMPVMTFNHRLPAMLQQPAIVLYQFSADEPADGEPVYNTDVAWPDDAPIIRAHDLSSEQNRKLFDYYAARQPHRHVYRVDRAKLIEPNYRPQYLGMVGELALSEQ